MVDKCIWWNNREENQLAAPQPVAVYDYRTTAYVTRGWDTSRQHCMSGRLNNRRPTCHCHSRVSKSRTNAGRRKKKEIVCLAIFSLWGGHRQVLQDGRERNKHFRRTDNLTSSQTWERYQCSPKRATVTLEVEVDKLYPAGSANVNWLACAFTVGVTVTRRRTLIMLFTVRAVVKQDNANVTEISLTLSFIVR